MHKPILALIAISVLIFACNKPGASQSATEAGQTLSNGHCTGTNKPKLTRLPMNPDDFAFILPYGLMVGGHVTPVDHQYFSPIVFDSAPDTYNVYAMGDSHLVDIQTRTHPGQGHYKNSTITDHRLVFSLSCHLSYYYDLVTSLADGLQEAFDKSGRDLPVTSGQLIGHIGNQTLDFAVWDTDIILTGFIKPEHYDAENWKIHTADPLNYYDDNIKAQALAKYIRTAEPRSGKIDYDVDGKLIGNWFLQNTDGSTTGYAGTGQQRGNYWTTHLSISPYFLDPTRFIISIGNWPEPEGASQFANQENKPDPALVSVDTGLVKYNLVKFHHVKSDGQRWDNVTFASPVSLQPEDGIQGCILLQMMGPQELKAESIKGQPCSAVNSFSGNALTYIR